MTTATRSKKKSAPIKSPEQIANNDTRTFDDFPLGTVSHQGDIIIVSIGSLPKSAKPRKSRQLAESNTQGSRHILDKGDVFDADRRDVIALIKTATKSEVAEQYVGPVFTGPAYLDHPEHGHQAFPKGCVCAVVYQRNLDSEEREARVAD
jgi:hypothetical protein